VPTIDVLSRCCSFCYDVRRGLLVPLCLGVWATAATTAAAEDLFTKFAHTQIPLVADDAARGDAPVAVDAPVGDAAPARGYDLAQFFPDLRMAPILAAAPMEDEAESDVAAGTHRDFAAIVEECKREALADARKGRGSIAASLPVDRDDRAQGTSTSFASLAQLNGRAQGRQLQSQRRPPASATQGMPRAAAPEAARPATPGGTGSAIADSPTPTAPDAARTETPATPVLPLPDALLADGVVPAVPNLGQQLPPGRNLLARSNLDNQRSTWSDAPNIVGDGCAPTGSPGKLSVGRICIISEGLTGNPLQSGNAAQINVLTQGQYNNVQAIKNAGYPAFTLPAQPLGQVAGTPPTSLPPGQSPGGGIAGVQSPSTFLASANNTFATNPSLNTSNYANLNPTTVYDPASSGALPNPNPTPPGATPTYDAFMFYNYVIDSNIILPGYAVGFVKLTENQSPIPRDRVYMTYSYFSNANFYPTKADVNRFMPGFEKTFYDGWTSVEIRTPFAATLSNNQTLAPGGQGVSEYRDAQFGNISVIFKTLIWEQRTWALSGGIQVMLPTANNTYLNGVNALNQPVQQVFVANESVHLMPFVGGIWAPNDRFFNQMLIQYEKDANGNLAYVNNNFQTGITGRQLQQAGRIFYPDFLYLSFGTGYWLYKDNTQNFTGFAPVAEIHVNQGLSAYCPIEQAGYQLGPNLGIVSVTNAMVGCNFEWGERSTLTFGYVTPLGGGVDRFFDGELRVLYNWRFGPQNRLTRAQF